MRRRSPSLDWIKTVLTDPEPRRDDLQDITVINDRDERSAPLIPDSDMMKDLVAELDIDLAADVIEK
jgi:hypothetical protein